MNQTKKRLTVCIFTLLGSFAFTQSFNPNTLLVPVNATTDVQITGILTITEQSLPEQLSDWALSFTFPGVNETLNDQQWVRNYGDDWVVTNSLWRTIEPPEFIAGYLPETETIRFAAEIQTYHQGITGEPRSLTNDLPTHHGTVVLSDLITGRTLFEGIILPDNLHVTSFTRRGAWVDAEFELTATSIDTTNNELNPNIIIRATVKFVNATEMP